jgi:hypothetical protein
MAASKASLHTVCTMPFMSHILDYRWFSSDAAMKPILPAPIGVERGDRRRSGVD